MRERGWRKQEGFSLQKNWLRMIILMGLSLLASPFFLLIFQVEYTIVEIPRVFGFSGFLQSLL
jgi:hypothetical protein